MDRSALLTYCSTEEFPGRGQNSYSGVHCADTDNLTDLTFPVDHHSEQADLADNRAGHQSDHHAQALRDFRKPDLRGADRECFGYA